MLQRYNNFSIWQNNNAYHCNFLFHPVNSTSLMSGVYGLSLARHQAPCLDLSAQELFRSTIRV